MKQIGHSSTFLYGRISGGVLLLWGSAAIGVYREDVLARVLDCGVVGDDNDASDAEDADSNDGKGMDES